MTGRPELRRHFSDKRSGRAHDQSQTVPLAVRRLLRYEGPLVLLKKVVAGRLGSGFGVSSSVFSLRVGVRLCFPCHTACHNFAFVALGFDPATFADFERQAAADPKHLELLAR